MAIPPSIMRTKPRAFRERFNARAHSRVPIIADKWMLFPLDSTDIGGVNMIEIREMTEKDIKDLLVRVGYGHLGCAQDNRPYVVPIQYIYENSCVYIYTNDGKKAEILTSNPHVCLQVEQVVDNGNWQSVVADGMAEQVTDSSEADSILQLMNSRIASPTPAMGITWVNNWISAKKEMIFKITIETLSGRSADKVDIAVASAVPARAGRSRIL
jgi:uncharacterized protein